MAKSLANLQDKWRVNYALGNASPMEAKAFMRDVKEITSSGGVTEKTTVNNVKQQTLGLMANEMHGNVPGLAPLDSKYTGLASAKKAIVKGTTKAMGGYPGIAAGVVAPSVQSLGQKIPNLARLIQMAQQTGTDNAE